MPLPDRLCCYKSLIDYPDRLSLIPAEADRFFLTRLGAEIPYGYYPVKSGSRRLPTGAVRVIDVVPLSPDHRIIVIARQPEYLDTFKQVLHVAGFEEGK